MSKERTPVHESYEIPDGLDFTGATETAEYTPGSPEYEKMKALEGEEWTKYLDSMTAAGISIEYDEEGDKYTVSAAAEGEEGGSGEEGAEGEEGGEASAASAASEEGEEGAEGGENANEEEGEEGAETEDASESTVEDIRSVLIDKPVEKLREIYKRVIGADASGKLADNAKAMVMTIATMAAETPALAKQLMMESAEEEIADVKAKIEESDAENKEEMVAQAEKVEESLKKLKSVYESEGEEPKDGEVEAIKEEGEELVTQVQQSNMEDAMKEVVKDKVEQVVDTAVKSLGDEVTVDQATAMEEEEQEEMPIAEAFKGKPLPTFEGLQTMIRENQTSDNNGEGGSEGAVSDAPDTDGNKGISEEGDEEHGDAKKETAEKVATDANENKDLKDNTGEGGSEGAVGDAKETDGNKGISDEGDIETGGHQLPDPAVYVAERAAKIKQIKKINESIKPGSTFKAAAHLIKENAEGEEEYNIKEGDEVQVADVDAEGNTVIAKHGEQEVKLNTDDFMGDSPKFESEDAEGGEAAPTVDESEEGDQFGEEIGMINKWFETYDGAEEFDWNGSTLTLKDADGKELRKMNREDLAKEISGFPSKEVNEGKKYHYTRTK